MPPVSYITFFMLQWVSKIRKCLHFPQLLIIFLSPKKEGHYVTVNRPIPWVFTWKLFILCLNMELPSVRGLTFNLFCRTLLNNFADHLPVFLQIISVVLRSSSDYAFAIICQYICITPPSIFKNSLQQFSKTQCVWRVPWCTFAENFLQRPSLLQICDALRDLASFVQFKKREQHPLRSVTFSKMTLYECLSRL